MQCQQVSELMSLRLDRSLPPAEERGVQEHLAGCSACRAEEALLQRVDGLLAGVPLLAPSAGFVPVVMAQVHRRATWRGVARGALALFLGALGLMALVAAPYLVMALLTLVIADSPTMISALVGVLGRLWGVLQTMWRAGGLLLRAVWASPNWLILVAYVALAAALGAWWARWVVRPVQRVSAQERQGRSLRRT